jgi:hypothetical protein
MPLALTSDKQPAKPRTASPQLPHFLPQRTTTHVPSHRTSTRDNLYLFLFFAALFAVIIAHAG